MTPKRKAACPAPAVMMPYGRLPAPQTLLELAHQIRDHGFCLSDRARRDVVSGILSFLAAVPEAVTLRPLGSVLYPLYARLRSPELKLSPQTRRNIISNVRRGLEWLYSNRKGVSAQIQPVADAWAGLWKQVKRGSRDRWTMSRFVRWCSRMGIAPDAVNDSTIIEYGEYVGTVGASRFQRHYQWITVGSWNRLAESHPGWPSQKLVMPANENFTGNKRAEYSPAFLAELDHYADLAGRGDKKVRRRVRASETEDQRRIRKGLGPETLRTRVMALRRAAALLAEARGVELMSITSLAHLVDEGAGPDIIDAYRDALENDDAPSVRNLAIALRYMAKAMFPADYKLHERMRILVRNTTALNKKMSKKHMALLVRLATRPADMKALFHFPAAALDAAIMQIEEKKYASVRDIALAHVAVAVAILLYAPVRIKNLAMLRIGESLVISGTQMSVVFPDELVKNEVDIDLELPPAAAAVVKRYRAEVLPRVQRRPDPDALFPGLHGSRDKHDFGELISRTLERWIGLKINPHAFRHLAAFVYLSQHRRDYETVRAMLGHKSIQTTMDFYCGLEVLFLRRDVAAHMAALAADFRGVEVRQIPRRRAA
jgi:integrase